MIGSRHQSGGNTDDVMGGTITESTLRGWHNSWCLEVEGGCRVKGEKEGKGLSKTMWRCND